MSQLLTDSSTEAYFSNKSLPGKVMLPRDLLVLRAAWGERASEFPLWAIPGRRNNNIRVSIRNQACFFSLARLPLPCLPVFLLKQ